MTIIRGIRALRIFRARISFSSSGVFFRVVVGEQDAHLLLVADKAAGLLQKVPALHGDAHVGHHGVYVLAVFFGVLKHPLDDLLVHVDFQGDAVGVPEDLVPLFRPAGRSEAAGPGAC